MTRFSNLDFTKTIKVLVGKDEKVFILHEELFTKRSPFFRAAFSQKWMSGEKIIKLPEDDSDLFNRYLNTVYHGELIDDQSIEVQTAMSSARLYVLADKYGDSRVANLCTDNILELGEEEDFLPHPDVIDFCYHHSHDGSLLRRLCVRLYAVCLDAGEYVGAKHKFPAEFEHDLLLAMMALNPVQKRGRSSGKRIGPKQHFIKSKDQDECRFHSHDREFNPVCSGYTDTDSEGSPDGD